MKESDYNPVPDTLHVIFDTREAVEKAYEELIARGYPADEISVLISDELQKTHFPIGTPEHEGTEKTLEKAGLGSVIGGTAGAVAGAVAALGTAVVIPGLGIAVAGPILASLTGAGAGGFAGGVVGALVGAGMQKQHAEHYEHSLKNGGIIVGFKPRTVEDRMEIITSWNALGGRQVHQD